MNSHKTSFIKAAFPHEHGSWGFFLEPIILSLLVAYSLDGLLIALSAFFVFLSNQPAGIILKNSPKRLVPPAKIFLLTYLFIALSFIGYLIYSNTNVWFLAPYFLAGILMLYYKFMEVKKLARNLFVELIAPISVIIIAICIPIRDNWSITAIIAFVFVLMSRSIQTVIYINNKLKFFKGRKPNEILVHSVGLTLLVILIIFALKNLSPFLPVFALLILISRSYFGLLPRNRMELTKIIGIKEFIYGFLFVVITSLGYIFEL